MLQVRERLEIILVYYFIYIIRTLNESKHVCPIPSAAYAEHWNDRTEQPSVEQSWVKRHIHKSELRD